MTDYTLAHSDAIQPPFIPLYPDGKFPWHEAVPPDVQSGDGKRNTGRLRACSYCGSMHPTDVVAAIQAGAHGSWADMKYGWPHKAYFNGVPNPHAGLLECLGTANHPLEGWIQVDDKHWRQPYTPAPATTTGKFYTVHLLDATPEQRQVIERHLGLHFEFDDNGGVRWTAAR